MLKLALQIVWGYLSRKQARWGVVEWIKHPLLMLEVPVSKPGHSISKNTTSLPETKWLFGARCVVHTLCGAYPVLGVTLSSDPPKKESSILF